MTLDAATVLTSTAIATVVSTVTTSLVQFMTAGKERVAREKLASDERVAREKLASDERIARERMAAEERLARRKELLLAKATEMAREHSERVMRMVDAQASRGIPTSADLKHDIYNTEELYRLLEHILDHGELPEEAWAKIGKPRPRYPRSPANPTNEPT